MNIAAFHSKLEMLLKLQSNCHSILRLSLTALLSGLELTPGQIGLEDRSSCLCLLSPGIKDVYHHA